MYLGNAELISFTQWRYLKHNWSLVAIQCIAPNQVWLSPECIVAEGVKFYPGAQVRGKSRIGSDTIIESNCIIENSIIGDKCVIGPNILIQNSSIGKESAIGFTAQIKRSNLGSHTHAKHHCYIGDTRAGNHVNFGAGSITGNYDGMEKLKTVIGDGAFIGINVNLIAPVNVGRHAFIAAGSLIRKDVPSHTLVLPVTDHHISRGTLPQKTDAGYERFRIGADALNALRHYFGDDLEPVLREPYPAGGNGTLLDLLRQTEKSIKKKVAFMQAVTELYRARSK